MQKKYESVFFLDANLTELIIAYFSRKNDSDLSLPFRIQYRIFYFLTNTFFSFANRGKPSSFGSGVSPWISGSA